LAVGVADAQVRVTKNGPPKFLQGMNEPGSNALLATAMTVTDLIEADAIEPELQNDRLTVRQIGLGENLLALALEPGIGWAMAGESPPEGIPIEAGTFLANEVGVVVTGAIGVGLAQRNQCFGNKF
jgi:hypothetical protein